MTPKEKAEQLVLKYLRNNGDTEWFHKVLAKNCAIIAVDEIIESSPRYPSNVDWDDCGATHQYYYETQIEEANAFWLSVKSEIQNL